jgi:plastocyanin
LAAVAGVACAALVVPTAAQAATKLVSVGAPKAALKVLQQRYSSEANDFFPHTTTVHVGDSVRFTLDGFHTVEIPAKGGKPLPFATTGPVQNGIVDAAGAPFWFNGQPQIQFNPTLLPSKFGKIAGYNGSKPVRSGLPLANGRIPPMTVNFLKKGTYSYYCNIHPGMEGTVKVLPDNKKLPTRQQVAANLKKQINRAINIAKGLSTVQPPAGSVYVGVGGSHDVEYFGMVPSTLTVPVGTTVKFSMPPKTTETHTATFGPGDPLNDPTSYLGQVQAGFNKPVFDNISTYPSDPPGTLAPLSPVLHGNGFWNSGAMDQNPSPLPNSNSVTFAAPGTYTYYCMIHPFMKATVTVQ